MYLLIQNPEDPALFHEIVFTFHNVSINSAAPAPNAKASSHLHSIMYLLIPKETNASMSMLMYLHSIMYLLILIMMMIKTGLRFYLHSIMYLLIRIAIRAARGENFNLHSIMYLLIL